MNIFFSESNSSYCKAYTVLALRKLNYSIDDVELVLILMNSLIENYSCRHALAKAQKVMNRYKL